ncbi:hypothetical protein VIGAN_02136500 [Vigna angularis var. angularis]|uniref:PB1-like domain-containing protein n=1 Tax=Vigna angularis var. angularis TaxID=157739 RepID=A0A0S3RDU0_PHAAN|nr:hypothetical protein VIGAN_02136500 [Vigna angularis var. angularis]
MEEDIEVVIHHMRKFVNDDRLKYEGQTETLSFDPNVWSYFIVVSVVKVLGYAGFKEFCYSIGGASVSDDRLEPLCDDTKGLLPAIQEFLPGVDQRFCVKHLYANFRKKYPGK